MSEVLKKSFAPEIKMIQELAFANCGLDLRNGKEELVTARVGKVMRKQHIATLREYYNYVVADHSGAALAEMIDALTTNYTGFFRENAHFDFLRSVILPASEKCKIRLWSAACSTGEEPYSIAFCLHDSGRENNSAEVIATDISQSVLRTASAGIYAGDDLKAIPFDSRRQYFLAGVGSNTGWFKVKPEIRRMVHFAPQNLLEPLVIAGVFDVIFCRNVMIYFNKQTQAKVVLSLEGKLKPGGYLIIGHSETLNGVSHNLQYVRPSVYRSVAS